MWQGNASDVAERTSSFGEAHSGMTNTDRQRVRHTERDTERDKQTGVVWCGVLWCGVVWCGVVWCNVLACVPLWQWLHQPMCVRSLRRRRWWPGRVQRAGVSACACAWVQRPELWRERNGKGEAHRMGEHPTVQAAANAIVTVTAIAVPQSSRSSLSAIRYLHTHAETEGAPKKSQDKTVACDAVRRECGLTI